MFTFKHHFISATLAAVALTAGFSVPVHANDCMQWSTVQQLGPAGYTGGVARAAYDSLRGRTVLFGGQGSTHEFDGTNWVQVAAPPLTWLDNYLPSVAFHTGLGRTMLLGWGNSGIELWGWNGISWTQYPNAPMAGRHSAAMVYDSARNVLVLFGGLISGPAVTNETWEWDGSTWTMRNPPNRPPGRQLHAMVYDSNRQKVVLFGGVNTFNPNGAAVLQDTWEWDGVNWVNRTDTNVPIPTARTRHAMTFDSSRGVTQLIGGAVPGGNLEDHTWEWDGVKWVRRMTGFFNAYYHAATFDPAARVTRSFRGNTAFMVQVSSPLAPYIHGQPANVTAAPGSPVQFTVNAAGESLNYQWRFNGTPIPGATLSGYSINAASHQHVGLYDCIVSNGANGDFPCGSATSIAATLTVETCREDINQDGAINVADLLRVISKWGVCN